MATKKFNQFTNEKKWAQEVHPKKGKMHDILGIDEDKKISDVYKSGSKLAEDLIEKVGKKKASSMINFAANVSGADNIFKEAQKHLSSIEEGFEMPFFSKKKEEEKPQEPVRDYTQGGKYREVEPGKFVPADKAFFNNETEELKNEILEILNFELELRDIPFTDDVEINQETKEISASKIVELLEKKGLI